MKKAHLYEALYLVNRGMDEALRGVQRLTKSSQLVIGKYHKSKAALERERCLINLQFMREMSRREELDGAYFEWEAEPGRKRRTPTPKARNSRERRHD